MDKPTEVPGPMGFHCLCGTAWSTYYLVTGEGKPVYSELKDRLDREGEDMCEACRSKKDSLTK